MAILHKPRFNRGTGRHFSLVCFLIVLSMTLRCEAGKHRFIYNSDGGNIFIDQGPPFEPEDAFSYIDEIAETSVTTFLLCPNAGMKYLFPSQTAGLFGDEVSDERFEEIKKVAEESGSSTERLIANLRHLVNEGHDPLTPLIARAKEKGLETFLTFRLNEIHDVNNPDSFLVSKFWRDHPEWLVGKQGDEPAPLYREIQGPRVHPVVGSWFWGAVDYSVPEVRAQRLAEIRECCERYDVDGLEIDFQRFPIFFKPGEEESHLGEMTDWVRQVRKMTQEISKQRGRPILLSVRTMARYEHNKKIGLDVETWAKEGLVDFITASHYLRNDYPIEIAEYRKVLPPDMPLYGSIEVEPATDTYRKIAHELWHAGVDGIYLFNFFTTRESGKEPPFELLSELGYPGGLNQHDGRP